ncbi:MAG: AraC family transcriptional regulator [Pseudomonadales bacterium]|nr:AraC family transcriptional regulator [Pseudomonadales bacterium]
MSSFQHLHNDSLTTSPALLRHLVAAATKAKIDVDELLLGCGINPDKMLQSHYRVPVAATVQLLQQYGHLLQDEYLGLLSSPVSVGYFRHSVLSVIHQKTLGSALQRYSEFSNVFIKGLSFHIAKKGRYIEATFLREKNSKIVDDVAIDIAMATAHRLAGWLCDELIILDKATLDFAPPNYHKEYRHLFYGAPVHFNCQTNSLVFEARYMDLPVLQTEKSAEAYVKRAPLDMYLPQDVHGENSRIIRKKIKSSIANNHFNQELSEIANEMGVSSQTIRRRLAKEGTSFNSIKSQVKREIAMNALGDIGLSIEEVAVRSGYSEPAAFIRAFKSWTGISPAKFRKVINSKT